MEKDLNAPIQYIKGVGPHRASLLGRIGINNVRDALFCLPYRYEDRRVFKKIAFLRPDELVTVSGKILKSDVISINPRLKILEVIISDGSALLKAKWFNQPYLKKNLRPGLDVIFYGQIKAGFRGVGLELQNPDYELVAEDDGDGGVPAMHTGRIVPIYHSTEGLSQRQFRTIMHSIVGQYSAAVRDFLPAEIVSRYNFPNITESLMNVHFPDSAVPIEDLNRGVTNYHRRLAFDELFTLQLGLALIKRDEASEKGVSFEPDGRLVSRLVDKLPYELTGAQQRVVKEILSDMRSSSPMHRLLQGDVGSGKTIVALISMLSAVECGYQAAIMAPTEILAEQHYLNIHRLVEELGLRIHLLTGSRKNKEYEAIASGDTDIVVGTHALIQESVVFAKLGLIVIDEQHRFGVMQRACLRKKGLNPDTLIMTATPIPRTLALTLYGDLDYSVIDELPPDRTPIITKLLYEDGKERIYRMLDDEVKRGGQAYVVYPVIEDSEKTNLKAAITGAEALQKMFPETVVGLIHGRMKTVEREDIMRRFKEGRINVLVSTTVIEVGVDVPNATLMVIIHAERFGLSQLHQLRGRVGRGGGQSFCILLCYGYGEDSKRRLDVMVKTSDGFRIAEEDLDIRGPGEFFGTKQSGIPDLKVANLLRDGVLLEPARKEAFALIESDPELVRFPGLKSSIEGFWGSKIGLFKTA
ncbi:MAG: ATP-dependent DNA helicase RecG [Nitrospirae bacterium]|nr:MAG: ATP-dependent DNA helicase RecG [Nitrospirota bacterium]